MDNLKDTQDYLQNIAHNHIYLQHDRGGRKSFSRFQTDNMITQIRKNGTDNIMVIAEVNVSRFGQYDDKELRRGVSVIIASRAATNGNAADAIDAAMDKSEEIVFDIINQMEQDQINECGLNFDLQRVTWDNIDGPWLENYYGWIVFIPFKGHIPPYDPAKWLS